jgi:hypothetical protein
MNNTPHDSALSMAETLAANSEQLNGDIVCSNEKGTYTTITVDAEQAS